MSHEVSLASRTNAYLRSPPMRGSGGKVDTRHFAEGSLKRVIAAIAPLKRASLNNRGALTARGGRWHVSNVKTLVNRLPA